MQQEKKIKQKKILTITTLILLIIAIIGLSYALWNRTFTQQGINIDQFDCFDIEFLDGKAFNLTNMYPQTDSAGLTNDPYNVTITNTCDVLLEYTIYIVEDSNSNLGIENVNFGVNSTAYKGKDLKTGTYQDEETETSHEGKIVTTNFLPGKATRELEFRAWMDENVSEENGKNKTYGYSVVIDASQLTTGKLLATNILLNNELHTEKPDFSKGSPACESNDWDCVLEDSFRPELVTPNGDGLFAAPDDDGTSYYFRGEESKINNNVHFAGMKWKIIRINGDGSIRLTHGGIGEYPYNISGDGTQYEDVGYTYDNEHDCTQSNPCISDYQNGEFISNYGDKETKDSDMKKALEDWYKTNLGRYDSQIALTTYCNDTSIASIDGRKIYYTPKVRIKDDSNPILTCPNPMNENKVDTHNYGGVYKLKIGLITADELNMAGFGGTTTSSFNNYLFNSYYLTTWTMSAWYSGDVSTADDSFGKVSQNWVGDYGGAGDTVPVINLKPDVAFTGTGTKNDPYVIQ